MRVECYTDISGFAVLGSAWDELLSHAVTDTIFLRPFWHRAWWSAYGAGKELRLLAVRDDGGGVLGIAPLFLHEMVVPADGGLLPALSIERPFGPPDGMTKRILHPVGGTEVSDYLDFIVGRESAPAVYRALFRYVTETMTDWDLLDLHCIPTDSLLLTEFPALARTHGYRVASVREEVCPIIELPAGWDAYLASLTKKQRHELRRKVRKANRESTVTWRKTEDTATLADDLALFFRLHERSDADKAAFWDDNARKFFREIAESIQSMGLLELSFLYVNEEPVGSYFCFNYKDDFLVYNSGYDPGGYRSLSPGLVLLSYVIQDAIARGMKRFDFLRGDERYKYDFGGVDREIFRLAIAPA